KRKRKLNYFLMLVCRKRLRHCLHPFSHVSLYSIVMDPRDDLDQRCFEPSLDYMCPSGIRGNGNGAGSPNFPNIFLTTLVYIHLASVQPKTSALLILSFP